MLICLNRFDFLHLKLLSGSFSACSPAKRYPQGVIFGRMKGQK
jgi:hypothetical protein